MEQELIRTIEILRKKGDYQYILSAYVDRSFWMEKIKQFLGNVYVENLTDFSYSTCFTMCINITDANVCVGTEDFLMYLKNNFYLYRLQLQVSAIAPFAVLKYIKYTFENDEIKMYDSFFPFVKEHSSLGDEVAKILTQAGIKILDEEILSIEVKGVEMELRESNVTVYHCLFEDEY